MLISIIQNIVSKIHHSHKRRETIRELIALDERTLKDIGLHEDDIPSMVDDFLHANYAFAKQQVTQPTTWPFLSARGIDECVDCAV